MVDVSPPDPPPPAGAVRRIRGDGRADLLVQEEPLLLVVHGQQLLTMRTPGRDDDLALGFLLGEGIVASAADVRETAAVAADAARGQPDELHVTLAREPDAAVRGRLARTHEIRSSCGICGMADPSALLDDLPPLLPGVPRVPRDGVPRLVQLLGAHQPLFAATGGCHAAVVAAADGTLLGHGEDVGRHNALDKAIGMAARAGADLGRSIAVLSGRAGFDLVLKCLRVRIPVVVSVSAPSGLAFDLCRAAGATLLGFARGADHRVYTDGARLC
ncbi:MAG: formate dehydrogenase accessory sulfurtransferase FdhD [Planctomycetota bacterium]